jgi:EmrB/QacA subfamily drug resistance transporter
MALRSKIVPLVVASPLFLQNVDSSVMATALPSIASSLDVDVLHLNLAITSYLLSLAVFLPLSGWVAERFGAKRVFCTAIAMFSIGSALCGMADSLASLVLYRILQGLGGAMMLPVGRLILLRSVPATQLIAAMVWFTVPPVIGRMLGPLLGGAIVTWTSWRWIFLVNIPFGLLSIAMAMLFIDDSKEVASTGSFDLGGFLLLAFGLTGMIGALEAAGKGLLPSWVIGLIGAAGLLATVIYCRRSKADPIIDFAILGRPTYRTSIIGGAPLRIAVGASPFLLPLMLQLGFGLSALDAGLLTVATAVGSLATRAVMVKAIRLIGYRSLLITTTALTSLIYASYALFTAQTPHPLMFGVLMIGGLVNALGMVALQTLGYSEIPKPHMSHATTLASMAQQLCLSLGVMFGASLLGAAVWWRGGTASLIAADFSPAFVAIGAMTLLSLAFFLRLKKDAE